MFASSSVNKYQIKPNTEMKEKAKYIKKSHLRGTWEYIEDHTRFLKRILDI